MTNSNSHHQEPAWQVLINLLKSRRSRRFGIGMTMDSGPLMYKSNMEGIALTEEEEALIVYAACGITGYALADLNFADGQGGTIMSSFLGRTIPSGDAIHCSSLIVINPEATYFIKRPQDYAKDEYETILQLINEEDYIELYRRSRVKIGTGQEKPPLHPFFNINCNQWSLYDPMATYFLPIVDFTKLYINGLLEMFNEHNGLYPLDERRGFRPAGVKSLAKSRGGHLIDDFKQEHSITIQQLETLVTELASVESSMMLQNIGLMTQALGLGGFTHWAAHYYAWFEALGFQMKKIKASKYLGMKSWQRMGAYVTNQDIEIPMVLGLSVDGQDILQPYCPPHYQTMEDAVQAIIDLKWSDKGIFGDGIEQSAWKNPSDISRNASGISEATIAATMAYCNYIYKHYQRFPAYQMPLRTVLGFQANHLDIAFYDKYYRKEALSDFQRNHFQDWKHPGKHGNG